MLDVLQIGLAEIADGGALRDAVPDQHPRRFGEQDLPAVARRADAGGADVHPEVALVADRGLAGVEAHRTVDVNAVRPAVRRKLALGGDRAGHGVPGPLEREEEGVSLRVDLAAARVGQLLAQDPAMLAVHVAVAVSELLEQPRRALNV